MANPAPPAVSLAESSPKPPTSHCVRRSDCCGHGAVYLTQLWLEVHDVRGRLAHIVSMLRQRGYTVTASKDDLPVMDAMAIFAVFATRR